MGSMTTEEHINTLLDKVRPYVEMHGGSVHLLRVEGNIAYCKVSGACTHCTLAEVTYTKTIAPLIVSEVPGITQVIFE